MDKCFKRCPILVMTPGGWFYGGYANRYFKKNSLAI